MGSYRNNNFRTQKFHEKVIEKRTKIFRFQFFKYMAKTCKRIINFKGYDDHFGFPVAVLI